MTESRARTDATTSGATTPGSDATRETTVGATREVHAEPVVREPAVREVDRREEPTHVSVAPPRRDRVRWGPVWAGLLVTVSSFVLFNLITFALGWWDIEGAGGSNADWISTAILWGAFFLGGLTAAASAIWRGVSDGILHGILVWALGMATFLVLSLLGGGAVLGAVGDAIGQLGVLQQNSNAPAAQLAPVVDNAQSVASWAVLVMGVAIILSALGGVLGAKMWPAKKDTEDDRVTTTR